jgi:hypothetical protein
MEEIVGVLHRHLKIFEAKLKRQGRVLVEVLLPWPVPL